MNNCVFQLIISVFNSFVHGHTYRQTSTQLLNPLLRMHALGNYSNISRGSAALPDECGLRFAPLSPPGESLDEMRLLEEQARRIAEEARSDQPKQKSMSFVK